MRQDASRICGLLVTALLIFTTYSAAQDLSLSFATIYNFTGTPDGEIPVGSLAIGKGGVLYGITFYGGTYGFGSVFSLTPPASPGGAWTETVLHSFESGSDGAYPFVALAIGTEGTLYGTTSGGGELNAGTVFSLTPPASAGGAWTERVLYNFAGSSPVGPASVVIGREGVLYGTTGAGGGGVCLMGCGTVFSLAPSGSPGGLWRGTVLYTFTGGTDGSGPAAGVVIGDGGLLYGTTVGGGMNGTGTVFSLTPPASSGSPWTETVLHSFSGLDGLSPGTPVVIGAAGVLYGSTQGGGTGGGGTVFSLEPPASPGSAWTATVLRNFLGGILFYPSPGPVVLGQSGVLYVTTLSGGSAQHGTVFALKPPAVAGGSWTEISLHVFGRSGGARPMGGVVVGSGGILYGTTSQYYGASSYTGTVFSLTL